MSEVGYGCGGKGGNVGGVGMGGYCPQNPFTSTGAILVLFILLVIITKAFCV